LACNKHVLTDNRNQLPIPPQPCSFTESSDGELLAGAPLQAAAAGLLSLALGQRELLLGDG
jgi:hypothetical protein